MCIRDSTPLALSIMAVELCGGSALPHVVIVCVLAFVFSGHRSIYMAQRLWRGKGGAEVRKPTALRELEAPRASTPQEREP